MLSSLPSFTLALVLSLAFERGLAAPSPSPSAGQTIQLSRRSTNRTFDEWGQWAAANKELLLSKYGSPSTVAKRSSGTNLIVNQGGDSSYYGSLAVGTPPVAFNVILDTGSADLWLADTNCIVGCGSVPTFSSSTSATFKNLTTSFNIKYGSGQAAGVLGQDIIQMAGFSVSNQTFGVCNKVSSGLLNQPVSGLMGLAFQSIASSGATPFWQTLVQGGAWDSPVMSFQLTRFLNVDNANNLEPGGTFTMGFVNQSLYTGDIDFQNIPSGQETYWVLPLTGLTAQGNSVTLPPGSSSFAAIDTGTTLVGGPSNIIAELYAQIPGSTPGTGNYQGYYMYPCNTDVTVTLAFGGRSWSISPADFQLTQLSSSQCLGAFFQIDMSGGSAPTWIIGDTFLKNVYSVFRFNPPSVGFAALSAVANSTSVAGLAVPTPTLGSVAAEVTATGRGSERASSGALPGVSQLPALSIVVTTLTAVMFAMAL